MSEMSLENAASQAITVSESGHTVDSVDAHKTLKFGARGEFFAVLRQRVDDYFNTTGRRQRDCPKMYLKTAIIAVWAPPACLGSKR